jgi:HEAT repeat protein
MASAQIYRSGLTGHPRSTKPYPALIKALTDEYSDVRRDAATALGRIADANALPALQQTLNDPDMDVRIFSQRAIDSIQKSLSETSNV